MNYVFNHRVISRGWLIGLMCCFVALTMPCNARQEGHDCKKARMNACGKQIDFQYSATIKQHDLGSKASKHAPELDEWVEYGPWGCNVKSMACSPMYPDLLLVGTNYYLYRTEDSGITWTRSTFSEGEIGFGDVNDIEFDREYPYKVFIATFRGLYRSVDHGVTFETVAPGVLPEGTVNNVLIDNSKIHVMFSQPVSWQNKIYFYGGSGGSWHCDTVGLNDDFYCIEMEVDPRTGIIYALGSDPFATEDNAICTLQNKVWQSHPAPLTTSVLNDLDLDLSVNPPAIYIASGHRFYSYGGLFRSENNCASWEDLSTSFPSPIMYSSLMDPDDPNILYAAADGEGVHKSIDRGATWMLSNDNYTCRTLEIAIDKDLFLGQDGHGVLYSNDNGNSWEDRSRGMTGMGVNDIAMSCNDPARAYVAWNGLNNGGVFRTRDNGDTWEICPGMSDQRFVSVAVHPDNADVVFAGASGPWCPIRATLYKSTDGGDTWRDVGPEAFLDGGEIQFIRISPHNPQIIIAGCEQWYDLYPVIFRSDDGGETFSEAWRGNVSENKRWVMQDLMFDPHDSHKVYSTWWTGQYMTGALLRSSDAGVTWSQCGIGIEDYSELKISADYCYPGVLMLAGYGGGHTTFAPYMYWSSDYGDHWHACFEFDYIRDITTTGMCGEIVLTCFSEGVMRSLNSGASWSEYAAGIPESNPFSKLYINPECNQTMYGLQSNLVIYSASSNRSPATPPPYTPPPLPTQTPVLTPTPQPQSCQYFTTQLWMPVTNLSAGDPCALKVYLCNPDEYVSHDVRLYVVLEIAGAFYCAPSFNAHDYYALLLHPGNTEVTVLEQFDWPENASGGSARWYAGLTTPDAANLMGSIAILMFNWQE